MKIKLIVLMIIMILPDFLKAKSVTYVRLGLNISALRNETETSDPGISFGLGQEHCLFHSPKKFIGISLNYSKKKIKLKDRTWRWNPNLPSSKVGTGDININISYLELPLMAGYSIIVDDRYRINISMGLEISIPIKNHTKITNQKVTYKLDEFEENDIDYTVLDENYIIPSIGLPMGISISVKNVAIIIHYSWGLTVTEGFTDLSMKDKIDTVRMSLAYFF
ncbi:PorT family protein [bacterium]|nr:PorT family protein [bacterium]